MNLISDFQNIANEYASNLCKMFELDIEDGWWVGDDVGGVYCNGDMFSITFEEMRYVVDNNISKDDFLEYMEYVSFCLEFNRTAPNLKSWIKGCPRFDEKGIQRLRELKKEFDIALSDFRQ